MNLIEFSRASQLLRTFFSRKGFVEAYPQTERRILSACEDPWTIATFDFGGMTYPLPQTGQMRLEEYLLKNPNLPGVFCFTTSYRDEPNPVEGRHDKIFTMCEFELPGNICALINLEVDLLSFLGFENNHLFITHKKACSLFGVDDIGYQQESDLNEDAVAAFLTYFPESTNPFWNMKRQNNTAKKVDVIIGGMETIGSAERETDPIIMRDRFLSISDGAYAQKLFSLFGEKRVMDELDEFLSFDFFVRSGGGMGMGRVINGMKVNGLL